MSSILKGACAEQTLKFPHTGGGVTIYIYIYIHIAGEKRRGPTIQSHSKNFITIVPKTNNDHPKCIRIHPTSIQNPSNIHPISFLNHPKPSKNHPNSSKIYPKPSRKIGCKRKSQIPPLSGKGVGGTRALAHSIIKELNGPCSMAKCNKLPES